VNTEAGWVAAGDEHAMGLPPDNGGGARLARTELLEAASARANAIATLSAEKWEH